MPHAGKQHRHAQLIGGGDYFLPALRTSGLNDAGADGRHWIDTPAKLTIQCSWKQASVYFGVDLPTVTEDEPSGVRAQLPVPLYEPV
jgi:hypothetical protein